MTERPARDIARWIALAALFLIPFTPLIVADPFFFPFITGKAFYFRILVEILVCAWAVLAFVDKRYRPRFSWLGAAVVAFVVWMFIADMFAINVLKAFWSNFERMEGWVLLAHLLGFFVAGGAVLRVEGKWRAWFLTSLGASVLVTGYALLQLTGQLPVHQGSTRIDASLGNSAYLAIYLLFSAFVAVWLAVTERMTWLKWSLIALAIVEGLLIFLTETRGTVLGLLSALIVAALLTAVTGSARARRYAIGAFAVILVLAGGLYLARNSSFVQQNHALQRVTSISLSDGQTRFAIWNMAFKGVLERPITGWGQEGFNYVFNKYYDPALHGQEPWFDRAHNAFIDWFSAGGFIAFFLYVSLFVTAVILLWRIPQLSRAERVAITSVLVGYAIHNLFVFDNLYSYIYFFALLALIDSQASRPFAALEQLNDLPDEGGMTYVLPVAAVTVLALIWTVNVPGMSVASRLIVALSQQQPVAQTTKLFEDLSEHPSFAAQEVREQFVSYAANIVQNSGVTDADKQQAVTGAITAMQKQVAEYPLDAREHLELSYAYRTGGDLQDSLKEVRAALALMPHKEDIYLEAGTLEWQAGDVKAAQKDFAEAYALGPSFTDLAAYAAAGDFAIGDTEAADQILMKAFGTTTVDSNILAAAYYRAKLWSRLTALWKLRVSSPNASVQDWFSYAAAQYVSGDVAGAIKTIRQVAADHPEAASSAQAAITQIQNGSVGQ